VIAHKGGKDPSAVAFDATQAAQSRGMDLLIVDTAGRLHTKVNLMEELKKICRTINKKIDKAPHEIWLVLDATTGQNALQQAKKFHEELGGITGIILTKLDGTAKGGILISLAEELKIPIRFIGVGEQVEDLRVFNAQEYVDALFVE
jgi:fused signal recognition particle receptor